jgi:energy-coupling factor transport system permease protein
MAWNQALRDKNGIGANNEKSAAIAKGQGTDNRPCYAALEFFRYWLRENVGIQSLYEVEDMEYTFLGQYMWGDSFIHRLDPRIKIISTVILGIAIVTVNSWLDFLLISLMVIILGLVSQIKLTNYWQGLSPFLLIIVATALFKLFMVSGSSYREVLFWHISVEGIKSAVNITIKLLLIVCLAQMLIFTTSTVALTDGFGLLVKPLNRVGIPVNELVFIMSVSLQFIPILLNEARRIRLAQLSRGVNFAEGSGWERTKAYFAILIPLINAAFEQANNLAESMEARAYKVGVNRSRLNEFILKPYDYIFLLITSTMAVVAISPIF